MTQTAVWFLHRSLCDSFTGLRSAALHIGLLQEHLDKADLLYYHIPTFQSGTPRAKAFPNQLRLAVNLESAAYFPAMDNATHMCQYDAEMSYRTCSQVRRSCDELPERSLMHLFQRGQLKIDMLHRFLRLVSVRVQGVLKQWCHKICMCTGIIASCTLWHVQGSSLRTSAAPVCDQMKVRQPKVRCCRRSACTYSVSHVL